VGNFDIEPKKATFTIDLRKLPCPLLAPAVTRVQVSSVSSCKIVGTDKSVNLNMARLTGDGEDIGLPPDGAVLVHIR
jgi:hypothetical protein